MTTEDIRNRAPVQEPDSGTALTFYVESDPDAFSATILKLELGNKPEAFTVPLSLVGATIQLVLTRLHRGPKR